MSSENRTSVPNSLNEHWMPFTSNKDFKANPRLITEAKGVYLKTHHGKTQIDASSGLFCNPLGHGRKEITEAVTKQLETLDYAQPFQQGFGGSFELASKIAKHTPGDLNKMFFTICGSTAVETAIKIAVAYHRAKGDAQRFRFVGRERGYHGMNIGCVSVGGMVNNVKTFASILMPGVQHIRHTHLPEHKFVSGQPETGDYLANDLETICANFGGENIAACIVEPIAGSTGTLVPPKGYLQKLREICDKYGILLIFDEVITGWGRTGSKFGADEFGVTPDIMTMAKATTNGVVPMGVVACNDYIYDAVMDASPTGAVELFHGYTYSGIPVAVAAALAVQDIFEKDDIFNRAKMDVIQMDPEEGAAALVSGDVVMACLFGGNSIKAATAVGSRLLTVQEARDAGILGIDITSVTDKFMKENPGMLRTFIEVTHEANARYAAGKSDMNVIAKDAEMKLGDMKETIGGFKFLTPSETEQSMTSGNLAGFLKGMGTPDGAVDTSFLPL